MLGFARDFPPDEAERELADLASAQRVLGELGASLEAVLAQLRRALVPLTTEANAQALFERSAQATRLAYARLARRHGRLGRDFHPYHNEGHILDVCGPRLQCLMQAIGVDALQLWQWCTLMLFGACHDLRQREAPDVRDGVGANERASWEEAERILAACGFSEQTDAEVLGTLELAIAGSTFDARPSPSQGWLNAADLVHSGGALAARLDRVLDVRQPQWRSDARIASALQIAQIAADLDTANVAEPFARFAASGEQLCREREMLAGRALDASESALPVLAFLGDGQSRFFFQLHRFNSAAGLAAFGAGKQANAPHLKALVMGMRARIALGGAPRSGEQVIAAYRQAAVEVA